MTIPLKSAYVHDVIEFWHNQIFWTAAASWFIAQTIKVVLGIIREKRFNFKWFLGTGGMPSSHAATVSSLATCVGVGAGFDSMLFAVTIVFTVIVMFDAQGVRRWAGRQAGILNKMLDDMYWKKKFDEKRLKELTGHTPIEVLAGAALGILVSLIMYP